MWRHRTLIDDAIEIFSNLCSYIGACGRLMNSTDGKNFLCVVAPEGGIRSYELSNDWLENIVDGWDKKNMRLEIARDIISTLSVGGLDSTSYLDLSIVDRDYFDDLSIELTDLTISGVYKKL